MEFKELQYKVIMKARSNGLLKVIDSYTMFIDVAKVFYELYLARDCDKKAIKRKIGESIEALIVLAEQNGLNAKECLEYSYNSKDGKTQNGVFIKDSDLIGDDLGDHYNEDGVRQ